MEQRAPLKESGVAFRTWPHRGGVPWASGEGAVVETMEGWGLRSGDQIWRTNIKGVFVVCGPWRGRSEGGKGGGGHPSFPPERSMWQSPGCFQLEEERAVGCKESGLGHRGRGEALHMCHCVDRGKILGVGQGQAGWGAAVQGAGAAVPSSWVRRSVTA